MSTEWSAGDLGTYDGINTARRMARVTITAVFKDGDLGVRYPTGEHVRVARRSVTRVIAPQHPADF